MTTKQFEIWLANLNPRMGSEAGKTRPVLVIQSDLLNKVHPSTIICPITTRIHPESQILRVHLKKQTASLNEDCDIMIDQIRAIDNRRLIKRIGVLPKDASRKVKENIKIILALTD